MSLEKIAEKLVKMVFTDFSHIGFVDSASKSSSKTELLKVWSHHLNEFFDRQVPVAQLLTRNFAKKSH